MGHQAAVGSSRHRPLKCHYQSYRHRGVIIVHIVIARGLGGSHGSLTEHPTFLPPFPPGSAGLVALPPVALAEWVTQLHESHVLHWVELLSAEYVVTEPR